MSRAATAGQGTPKAAVGGKPSGWLIRSERGETFGPVELSTLQAWAAEGRIAPASEISSDGIQWRPVTAQRELEMVWVAEVSPGSFYGPIHRQAMDELLRDGSIAAHSLLYRREETEPAGDARVTDDEARAAEAKSRLAAAEARASEAEARTTAVESRAAEAETRATAAEARASASARETSLTIVAWRRAGS